MKDSMCVPLIVVVTLFVSAYLPRSVYSTNAPTATIGVTSDGKKFLVTYSAGATWSCTVYQQQVVGKPDSNFPDGRYTPKHCWSLEELSTSYVDDWSYIPPYDTNWLVWAELSYATRRGPIATVKTNTVKVHY